MKAAVPCRANDTASRAIGKKAMIIKTGNYRAYTLNASGTRIWGKINSRNSERGIAEKIFAEYDAAKTTVQRDVRKFLHELEKEGLLVMKSK
ncbi:MAG: PqqD family protein [Candidatus Diapherotrites archaeon]